MLTAALWSLPIKTLGVPCTFIRAKELTTEHAIPKVGIRTVTGEDDPLVQGVGFGTKIITVRAIDITGVAPAKFDIFDIGGTRYTANTVIKVHQPNTGTLLGWRIYATGV